MSNYAVIDDNGLIVNMVAWDGDEWSPGDGLKPVKADDDWVIGGVVIDGKYTVPEIKKPSDEELISLNIQTKSALMVQATNKISILQYSVDLDMATDDEKTTLLAMKKYIVLLNRIDTNTPGTVTFPDLP